PMIPSTMSAPMPSPPPPIGSPKPPPPPPLSSPRRSSMFELSGASSRRIDLSSSPCASVARRKPQVHRLTAAIRRNVNAAMSSAQEPASNPSAQDYGYLKANTIVQIFSE